jgi:putative ABC transport system permease protein
MPGHAFSMLRQAIFIASGLAIGVGLVITVSAAAADAKNAQTGVLHELYGLGTDITVTRPYTPADAGPGHQVNAGTAYEFLDTNQGLFSSSAVASVTSLPDVRAAVGVLDLDESDIPANARPSPGSPPGTTILVDGVEAADQGLGPLSQARVIAGRDLTASDADAYVALADSGYATEHHLGPGSVITLAHHEFRVVGVVSQPAGTAPSILIPIQAGQELAHFPGEMTTVYVAASSATRVSTVAGEIKRALPSWADVTTSARLANEISGSLATTARLANDLGRWLAATALIAAFLLAALLTVAAVSRRVREFGTLKALGWRTRRITVQVVGESAATGIVGALAGTGPGYAASALISWLASAQNATVAAAPGSHEPHGFIGEFPTAARSPSSCPSPAPTTRYPSISPRRSRSTWCSSPRRSASRAGSSRARSAPGEPPGSARPSPSPTSVNG